MGNLLSKYRLMRRGREFINKDRLNGGARFYLGYLKANTLNQNKLAPTIEHVNYSYSTRKQRRCERAMRHHK